MGNPFCESGKDLIVLDTRDIVEDEVKEAVLDLVMLGQPIQRRSNKKQRVA